MSSLYNPSSYSKDARLNRRWSADVTRIRHWLETKRRERLVRKAADLEAKGLNNEALRVYNSIGVVGRKDDPDSLDIDIECLVRQARLYSHTGQSQLSTEATGRLIQLLAGINDYFCRNRRAWAHYHLAAELAHSGRFQEGMEEYDELVSEFGFDDDPGIEEYVAAGLVSKGLDLTEAGQPQDAMRCFNEVLKRFEASTEPNIQPHIAEALYRKAMLLAEEHDLTSAAFNYQLIVDRFANHEQPSLRSLAGRALFELAELSAVEGKEDETLEAYKEVVYRFADSEDPETRSIVGVAYGRMGAVQLSADRFESAVDAFSAMAAHIDGLDGEVNHENLLSALYWKGESLALGGQVDEALHTFEAVFHGYELEGCVSGHDLAAGALFAQGLLLGGMGRLREELMAYEKLRSRFGENQEPDVQYCHLYAMVNSIVALRQLNRVEEAAQLDRELVARYCASSDPEIRQGLDLAESNRSCGAATKLERFQTEPLSARQLVGVD